MKQNGFAGVMVWALDLDDFKNSCGFGKYPLLTAINQELGGGVISRPPTRPRKPKMYVYLYMYINLHKYQNIAGFKHFTL